MHTIPLLWHGDDADSHRRRTFCVCTISSVLLPMQSSWDSKLVCYITDNNKCLNETFQVLDAWMVHSLSELQTGCYFSVDPWNREYDRGRTGRIMGPWTAVLVGLKGDQKYIQRVLRPQNSWISHTVCLYCAASSQGGELLYTHHGPAAPHRATLLSNEQFLTRAIRPNPWMRLPGFHVELVLLDYLHLVDLSIIPEVSASAPRLYGRTLVLIIVVLTQALLEITRDNSFFDGASHDERLRMAFVAFTRECKKVGVRPLTAGMFVLFFHQLALDLFVSLGNRGQVFSVKLGSCP